MSHFTVLVIGDVDEQLAPFDENIEVPEYQRGLVSQEDKDRFLNLYQTPSTDRDYAPITEEQAEENKKLSFDELYDKYGEDWNSNDWRKNENGEWAEYSTYNPKSKWDWYQLGGRWSGDFFILKHGAEGGIRGSAGVFNNETGIDSIRLGDVDWEAMRKRGEEKAKEYWEDIEKALGGNIPQPEIKWLDMVDENNEKWKDVSIDEKRKIYSSQPALKELSEAENKNPNLFGFFFSLEEFNCSKEKYIERGGKSATVTYALVAKGEWHEKGEMGWFGMSANEKEENDWFDEFSTVIAQCDEDERVSLVDCHI